MKRLVLAIALCSAAFTAWAQHQPYAGHQDRAIKALSAEEIEQYLSGSGMGFAKSAELNGYPGPMHVIELADKLLLTPTQRIQTQALMDEHKRAARELGARLVAAERELEQEFRTGAIEAAALEQSVQSASRLQSQYRLSHLETHRRMRMLLSTDQLERYAMLRGYGDRAGDAPAPMRHH